MSNDSENEIKWIEKSLLPKIVKLLGKEGKNVHYDISFPENCFFFSYICFLDLSFGKSVTNEKTINEDIVKLVIKKPPSNPLLTSNLNVSKQFHNEILFYTKFVTRDSRFPRCIYATEETIDDTVIVIENISIEGYELCPELHDIPIEYVFSAVKEIARFHAIGYVMKEREPDKFNNIISDIQEPRFKDNSWIGPYINVLATRPIDWLRRNNCEKKFCDTLEKYLGNAYEDIMLYSIRPVEPIATLCHGDFTRNNVFFRKIDGKLEAKPFDFALIRYSSPAIDLSTFLYLHCSAKDRNEKFYEIYRSYHETLMEYLRDSGINHVNKYSYDNMLADYKRRAAFGYIIAVFFLPEMIGLCTCDRKKLFSDPVGCGRDMITAGGEVMTELFGKMILELRDLGSFYHLFPTQDE